MTRVEKTAAMRPRNVHALDPIALFVDAIHRLAAAATDDLPIVVPGWPSPGFHVFEGGVR